MKLIAILAIGLLAFVLAACEGLAGEPQVIATMPPQQPMIVSLPAQAPDLARGAQVYAENCVRCHGESGRGDGVFVQSGQVTSIVDFTQPSIRAGEAPADYFRTVTEGRIETLMPPWREALSETDRWAVALYVYMLPYNNAALLDQGRQVWEANCTECHAADGSGSATEEGAPLPTLLDVSNDTMVNTLLGGIQDKMPAFNESVTPEAMTAVLAYARSLGLANAGQAPVMVAEAPANVETAPAETAPMGVISGQIINGTAGADVPGGLALTLHVVADDFSETTFEATTDAAGAYRIENVPLRTDRSYVVTTSYGGQVFMSDIGAVDPAVSEHALPVTVYEAGADAAAIVIDRMMMQVAATHGQLTISQLVSFRNTSDRIYVIPQAAGQTSVMVNVPQGAQYADFMGGGYQVSEDGRQVTDVTPVLPGQPHVMHLTYLMPYSADASVNFDQPMPYPIDGPVEVVIATDGLNVTTDVLREGPPRETGSRAMRSFSADLAQPAGQSFRIAISGTPVQVNTITAPETNPLAYVFIALGVLALMLAAVLFVRERRQPRLAAAGPDPSALMKQIAALDVQHRDGKLEQKHYERERARLKAQLTDLMKMKTKGGTR